MKKWWLTLCQRVLPGGFSAGASGEALASGAVQLSRMVNKGWLERLFAGFCSVIPSTHFEN